ncbi:MAG TPA: hypothetical protein QGF02_01220 [Candidatus Babeliales bacterium]|nr:hypothetical protein [Candidatus Babeliales bacterium]
MNQKLILSLLVGSIACGIAADVAPEAPAAVNEAIVQEEIAATSRLAKLRKAAALVTVTPVCKTASVTKAGFGYVGDVAFYGLRKGQGAYNFAAETRAGSTVRNALVDAANNREVVGGTVSSLVLAAAGYKFGKTPKGVALKDWLVKKFEALNAGLKCKLAVDKQ